jgi:hypothetical protein
VLTRGVLTRGVLTRGVLTRGVLTRGVLTPGESVPDEGTPSEGTPDEGVADGCAGTCPVVIACCTMKTSTAGTTFGPGGGLSPPTRKTAPVRPSPAVATPAAASDQA